MDIKITPKKLKGTAAAISSKSDAHRRLIAAALSDKPTEIFLNIISKDIEATIGCLEAMGAKIERRSGSLYVTPMSVGSESPMLNCCESGSTLRFLLPVAAAVCHTPRLTGDGRLPARPLSPLIEEMENNGCKFSSKSLPMTIESGLTSGVFKLPGNISSQYITGLLLSLPLLEGDSDITLTSPLESRGYVNMTLDTLNTFGIGLSITGVGYHIPGGQKYISPGRIDVEGDWSNAAFWLTADFLGGNVSVTGTDSLSPHEDKQIINILGRLKDGCAVDARDIPDLVPIIAVAACGIAGTVTIYNVSRLRLKESDRIQTVTDMITSLGGSIASTDDSIIINGTGSLKGGHTDGFNDHRIVMAAAIASCICEEEVVIHGAQAVNKSYPGFFDEFNALGGEAHVI